jgi:hypothetical protein
MESRSSGSLARCFRHNRLGGRLPSYDVVEGPMLGSLGTFLRGQALRVWGQQTSFHSDEAIQLLGKGLVR